MEITNGLPPFYYASHHLRYLLLCSAFLRIRVALDSPLSLKTEKSGEEEQNKRINEN